MSTSYLAAASERDSTASDPNYTPANVFKVRRALLSVSDKAGLADLAKALHANGVEMLSTGGTAKAIRNAGLPCKDVSEFTESPEIMDGRVKSLHPRVHGGILMRELPGMLDSEQLAKIGGAPIDLVVVNLYPFASTVAKGAPYDECIENIDIGGPTMVRAAAKNHARVSIVVLPSDYGKIINSLPSGPSANERKQLALKVRARDTSWGSRTGAQRAGTAPPAHPPPRCHFLPCLLVGGLPPSSRRCRWMLYVMLTSLSSSCAARARPSRTRRRTTP
jgi:hypothetical protein